MTNIYNEYSKSKGMYVSDSKYYSKNISINYSEYAKKYSETFRMKEDTNIYFKKK